MTKRVSSRVAPRCGELGYRRAFDPVTHPARRSSSVVAAIALALLAACQTPLTPQSIVDQGTRTSYTLREEPHRAAVCIARNVDRQGSPYTASIRAGAEPVLIEVHVSTVELVSLAQLLISGEGSTAVIWMTPDRFEGLDALIEAMIEGC